MVFFHRHAPTPATPPATRKKNSAMLESRLQDLQETLCSRTSKFHVQVSVPTVEGDANRFSSHADHHHRHHPHKCHSCIPVQNEHHLPHRSSSPSRSGKHFISRDRISGTLNPYGMLSTSSALAPSSSSSAYLSSSAPSSSNAHGLSSVAPIHGYAAKIPDYIESAAVSRIRSKIGLNVYHNLSLMHNRLQNLPFSSAQQNETLKCGNVEQDHEGINPRTRTVSRLDILRDQQPQPLSRSTAPARNDVLADGHGESVSDSDSEVSVSAISWKVSALKDDIESFSQGNQAPRKQLELLRQKHKSTEASIQSLEKGQTLLRDKITNLEQRTRERDKWLEMVKLDRMRTISEAKPDLFRTTASSMNRSNYHHGKKWPHLDDHQENLMNLMLSSSSHGGSSSSEGGRSEIMKISEFWSRNNCDFHVNKIIHMLRRLAAYEILEFCHSRLSSHMVRHICGTLQELGADSEKKASYLKMFGLPEWLKGEEDCGKHLAALSLQMTYAELLEFVNQQEKEGKRVKKELFAALKAAEKGLLDEAERESYDRKLVGDIRWQMTGFKQLESRFKNTRYDQSMAKFQKLEETKDIVGDIMKTIDEGDLGILERCSKLIRLGCYFLERQRLLNPPSAAEELESLNLDANFD